MKLQNVILFALLFPFFLFAQEDTTQSIRLGYTSSDSLHKNKSLPGRLPPRELIIKMKDLKEIRNLTDNPFKIIDDTAHYTEDELSSGLSGEELASYKKNKEMIKQLLIPPPGEEETYPAIATVRKILGVAKTAAVIIIMILSLL